MSSPASPPSAPSGRGSAATPCRSPGSPRSRSGPSTAGAGLLAPLFAALLADARERGAVVSALFPTAPGIYRRLGYEIVGELADVDVPVEPLTRIPAPAGITLRRADPDDERDVAAHRAVYDRWACAQNGPLTREGPLQRPLDGRDTVTLALDAAGTPVGYAAWSRADAVDPAGARAARAHRARDRRAVAAVRRVREPRSYGAAPHVGSGPHAAGAAGCTVATGAAVALLPAAARRRRGVPRPPRRADRRDAAVHRHRRRPGRHLPADRAQRDRGLRAGQRRRAGGPVFTGRGLALAYAGVQSCANLRFAGLLSGPDTDDTRWDALLGGRPFHIRNYF